MYKQFQTNIVIFVTLTRFDARVFCNTINMLLKTLKDKLILTIRESLSVCKAYSFARSGRFPALLSLQDLQWRQDCYLIRARLN